MYACGSNLVFMQIAAGGFHAAAVSTEGDVFTWGCGKYGVLGTGDLTREFTPKRVTALRGVRIVQVRLNCNCVDACTNEIP
jgi:alpha-tubulin suppressor-like RCC1 family protein